MALGDIVLQVEDVEAYQFLKGFGDPQWEADLRGVSPQGGVVKFDISGQTTPPAIQQGKKYKITITEV